MLLVLHAVAGTAALVVGPLALVGVRRTAAPYRALVLVVAGTALLLGGASTLPGAVRTALAVVAVGSAAAVLVPSPRALRASYVALVAALAFVSAPVWVGAGVVIVGSALVHGVPVRVAARAGPR